MSNTLSRAWSWSVRYSPLLVTWRWLRGVFRPNREALALLDAAGMPVNVDRVIRVTVVRTKLWRDERAQIARELIVHTQDAMEAGREPHQVVESFGDPRRVARLLRRSMKRKRPVVWHAYRSSKRALISIVCLLIVGYATFAARFYLGEPNVTRNYAAELNARTSAYPDDQKAWEIYSEADIAWTQLWRPLVRSHSERTRIEMLASDDPDRREERIDFPYTTPAFSEYDKVVSVVHAFEPHLVKVREASRRAVIGAPLSSRQERVQITDEYSVDRPVSMGSDELSEVMLIDVLLPHPGIARQMAIVLAFDAQLAMREGDTDRAVGNIVAIFHIAHQLEHEPFMFSGLVGVSIKAMSQRVMEILIRDHSGALSIDQLTELAHANAIGPERWMPDLTTERMMFMDFLQRGYTDDGDGNGRLTPRGADLLVQFTSFTDRFGEDLMVLNNDSVKAVIQPGVMLGTPDRRTAREHYHAFLGRAEEVFAEGPRAIGWMHYDRKVLEWDLERNQQAYSPVKIFAPAISGLVSRAFKSEMGTRATATMLAIEVFRLRNGRLPLSLDDIPLTLLPTLPIDHFDEGNTLRYKPIDGAYYMLYSVGQDGDDDNGVMPVYWRTANSLEKRYPFVYTEGHEGKPMIKLDQHGRPVIGAPDEYDSDYVLIDTRPIAESDTGSS